MSSFRFLIAGMVIPLLSLACASRQQPDLSPASAHMVCVVPGVSGDAGPLRSAITEAGFQDVRTFAWGSPVFLMNFQSTSIHEQAEKDLAARLTEWFGQRPDCRIDLVGHSAGCGVILGALAKLDPKMKVHQVILLAPSVSPQYDLAPALRHIAGNLDVFYSDQDTFFLKWRTGTFGTYDNIKTPAAGHLGFHPQTPLPADLAGKVVQHAYDPKWKELGNDGGHSGPVARDFVKAVVAPLLRP